MSVKFICACGDDRALYYTIFGKWPTLLYGQDRLASEYSYQLNDPHKFLEIEDAIKLKNMLREWTEDEWMPFTVMLDVHSPAHVGILTWPIFKWAQETYNPNYEATRHACRIHFPLAWDTIVGVTTP